MFSDLTVCRIKVLIFKLKARFSPLRFRKEHLAVQYIRAYHRDRPE